MEYLLLFRSYFDDQDDQVNDNNDSSQWRSDFKKIDFF